MAVKRTHPILKAISVIFTSFVAPVLVSVVGNALKVEEHKPAAEAIVSESYSSVVAPAVTLLPPATVSAAAGIVPAELQPQPAPTNRQFAWRAAAP
jgi:hypothetical protein